MADLAAANVTITVQAGTPWNPRIEGTKRKVEVRIQFGDGALTYPVATGVPMPSFTKFGLVRNLEYVDLYDQSGTAYKVAWDRANKSIRLFDAGAELAATDTPAAQSFHGEAIGW